jgi:serpin B
MTYAGARGDTEMQMARVLRFSQGHATVHSSFGELQQQLSDTEKPNGIQLDIANALWTQNGEPFLPAFLKTATDDFKTDADAVRREINGWVAQKTKDKIQDILPPGSIDHLTRLVLDYANHESFPGHRPGFFAFFGISRFTRHSMSQVLRLFHG